LVSTNKKSWIEHLKFYLNQISQLQATTFKAANKSFADRGLSKEALPAELMRWGNWHWGRIVFEAIAFCTSLLLLIN